MPITDIIKRTLARQISRLLTGAILAAVLWMTNPSHLQHEVTLHPSGIFEKDQPLARRMPDGWRWDEHLEDSPKTVYHNHAFFSTTTNKGSGARGSIGILGFVFDLRTEQQKETERPDYVQTQGAAAAQSAEWTLANLLGWR